MIMKILRYINTMVQIVLFIMVCICLIKIYNKQEVQYSVRELSVVSPTYSYDESEAGNVINTNSETSESLYDELQSWDFRYPDIELPDYDGIDKDVYGNYILTEEMLSNNDNLPFNEDGYIDYVFYYDSEGNILNPLSELYNRYLGYFGLSGG